MSAFVYKFSLLLSVFCVICMNSSVESVTDKDVTATLAKSGLAVAGITLCAKLVNNPIVPGDPVNLELTYYNEGDESQCFDFSDPLWDFPLIVQDDKGNIISQSEHIGPMSVTGAGIEMILPHSSLDTSFQITPDYHISTLGTYKITAISYIYSTQRKRTEDYCVSNTVKLVVSDTKLKQSKDFILAAGFTQKFMHPGKPVILLLCLKNISTEDKNINIAGLNNGFQITLLNFHGDIQKPLKSDKDLPKNENKVTILKPGDIYYAKIDLASLFDLSKEGRYFVSVQHDILEKNGDVVPVYSTTIDIEIKKMAQ